MGLSESTDAGGGSLNRGLIRVDSSRLPDDGLPDRPRPEALRLGLQPCRTMKRYVQLTMASLVAITAALRRGLEPSAPRRELGQAPPVRVGA